jgi:hypothetical protein
MDDNIAVVKRVVEGILAEDLEPALDLLAGDVRFKVAIPGEMPICFEDSGKQGVIDYFKALGGIVTFWQVEFLGRDEHVIVLGNEGFTLKDAGITARSDFALIFDVHGGLITRFLVVEDLWSFLQDGYGLIELENRLVASSRKLHWRSPAKEAALASA